MGEHNSDTQHTESAGGIVLNMRGEVAMVRNGPGLPWWGFPKGHVDDGEELLEAAKREIMEETGIRELTFVHGLGSYGRYKGKAGGGDDTSEYKTIHMFLFSTEQENIAPIDPGNPEAKWVPKGEVANLLTHPLDAEFYHSVLPTL